MQQVKAMNLTKTDPATYRGKSNFLLSYDY